MGGRSGNTFGKSDTKAPLREAALAQIPPGKRLEKGDGEAIKQAILDGLNAHPDLFTSTPDMVRYLEVKHGVSYTTMRISQLFRELGVGMIDGRYAILPMHLTQGDAWDQLSDDIKVYAAEDPRLRGEVVYLHVRGGTTNLFDIDLLGVRLDPTNTEKIMAVTTGWADVVVHFEDKAAARRFWVRCMRAHRGVAWADPEEKDTGSTKDALYQLLKKKGVLGQNEGCETLGLEPADFKLLMNMLMQEYPISKMGKAYSLHTGQLFWEEQGLKGKQRNWDKISDSEMEDRDGEGNEDGGE